LSYDEFLQRKQRRHHAQGPDVPLSAIHPLLHDWQAAIVRWACRQGRAAIFADCGLGKTFMQIEWARLVADRSMIIAPLSVARQTVREATKLGVPVRYVRHAEDVGDAGIHITNYEMADEFDPADFDAVVLDESSILKNYAGATRNALVEQWQHVSHRLACTATPAPNDVAELTNHAEFLGVMSRNEMLSAYFVHDDDGWRLKGHAVDPMFAWMAQWAVAVRKPSDLGYSDAGYDLPPLTIRSEVVEVEHSPEGQLFATDLGGIGGRHVVRRSTLAARVRRAAELANGTSDQWIIWCGLNDEASSVAAVVDGAVNVEGSWSADDKAEALEAFQDGAVRVLVTKPSIAGFGMNFQNAHRMIFVGLNDSYEAYYQAIRRCWRFGQSDPVDAHVVVSALEQQIVENVRRKEAEGAVTTDRLVRHMGHLHPVGVS
jgi:superfamily II DNA or RNA helicase